MSRSPTQKALIQLHCLQPIREYDLLRLLCCIASEDSSPVGQLNVQHWMGRVGTVENKGECITGLP